MKVRKTNISLSIRRFEYGYIYIYVYTYRYVRSGFEPMKKALSLPDGSINA